MLYPTSLMLPLVSDSRLRSLKRQYEITVGKGASPASPREHRRSEQALDDIERELRARGIDAEPWWVEDGPRSN